MDTAGPTYQGLADWYDRLMSHVDYRSWATYLRRLLVHVGHKPRSLLELAAGTCRMSQYLRIPGCRKVLTDLSPSMLACSPLPPAGPRIAADARSLPFRDGSFDTILMCYDAFDYLLTDGDALRMLEESARVLCDGGLLVFDTTTRTNSLKHFHDGQDVIEDAGGMLVRRWWFDETASIQNNRFDLFGPLGAGTWSRQVEHHRQRIRSQDEVASLLGESGLRLESCLAGFGFVPAGPSSERIHYLASRPHSLEAARFRA